MLDTNILISACLKPHGLEAQTIDLARSGAFTACVSPAVLAEYRDVLFRAKFASIHARASEMLAAFEERALVVEAAITVFVASDEDDNRLLECASAARAEYLVTGNRRHFPAVWESVQIVNAREFLTAAFSTVMA